jgi:hypothetical protein
VDAPLESFSKATLELRPLTGPESATAVSAASSCSPDDAFDSFDLARRRMRLNGFLAELALVAAAGSEGSPAIVELRGMSSLQKKNIVQAAGLDFH